MERPLMVFIVGTTAVGKTKLSIEISKALGGQVVNCDSKQLYKYANIMTAKADAEEIQGVPHHMLDVLELNQSTYNRNKYFSEALKCLNDIKARGKVPVIVGGTNYYLETLLYDIDLPENNDEYQEVKQERVKAQEDQNRRSPDKSKIVTKEMIQNMTKQQKYAKLKQVDPVMAQKLHANDETRTTTFLTRYAQTGVAPSINYKPQIHKLRTEQNILFWVRNSDKQQLHQLMTKRINKMVDGGGLVETLAIFKYADMHGLLGDMKMGALQSIGYKQFKQVYAQVRGILSSPQFDSKVRGYPEIHSFVELHMEEIRQKIASVLVRSIRNHRQISILERCKQVLVKNTMDYSKRQITWIKNRLFSCQENKNNFFVLQLCDKRNQNKQLLARFDAQVKTKALEILNKIKVDGVGSVQENIKEFNTVKHQNIGEWKKYYCEDCKVQVNGTHQWEQHLRSRKHRGASSKKQKKYEKKNVKQNSQKKKQQAIKGKEENSQKQKGHQNKDDEKQQKQQKSNEQWDQQQNAPYKKKSTK